MDEININNLFEYQTTPLGDEIKSAQYKKSEVRVFLDGIRMFVEDELHPIKGFNTPNILESINLVKRVTIESLKMVGAMGIMSLWIPFKLKEVISSYNRTCFDTIKLHILKREYQTPTTKVISDFTFAFLLALKIPYEESDKTATIISHIFEYDLAYRFRIQNILAETSNFLLHDFTYSEIRRLLEIWIRREEPTKEYIRVKLRIVLWVSSLIFLIPKYRKAFKMAISKVKLGEMYPDEADLYWMKKRKDYDFNG